VDVSTTFSLAELEALRPSRRHLRRSQFGYLYLSRLICDLRATLAQVPTPVRDVLDVYWGSRPHDGLMPDGARVVGIDVVGNPYSVADVVFLERNVTHWTRFRHLRATLKGIGEVIKRNLGEVLGRSVMNHWPLPFPPWAEGRPRPDQNWHVATYGRLHFPLAPRRQLTGNLRPAPTAAAPTGA
jgi:hypothetical protein